MRIKPLFDRVVLVADKKQHKTNTGIFLSSYDDESSQTARVVAVGDGVIVDGKPVPLQVKTGDKVLYSQFAGTSINLDNVEYLVVKQTDILAILNEENINGEIN